MAAIISETARKTDHAVGIVIPNALCSEWNTQIRTNF